jgi:solute:Na+ symporter, SSS family
MRVALIDWLIVAAFFVFFLALAIYINGKVRSVADYLVSGRKVRMWLGIGAGIAGEVGLVSVVSQAEQGFLRGYSFTLLMIMWTAVMLPLFGIFGFGIERFRATRAMSVPEYLEMRYSRNLRILTGIFNSLAGVLQMCIFPIVGAAFLRVLIGAPESVSVLGAQVPTTWLIMAILLACNVVFVYLGGYITLTVTNFFMMILIMGAIAWLVFHLVARTGLQHLWTNLENTRGLAAFYPFTGEAGSYGFVWFCWMMTMSILMQFSYGPYLQKYASMDKPKTVSRSYLLGTIFGNGRTFLIMGLGVAALAAMGTGVPAGVDASATLWPSMATAHYLAEHTPAVLMGLLLACLLFADISTTDQYLISWSTSIVNDAILPFRRTPLAPTAHIMAVRITVVVLCVLFFVVGTRYRPTMPIWEYLWLCANIIGGTGIAVLFGMYWPRASTAGAYAAVLANLVLPVADLAARWMWLSQAPGRPYPLRPEQTGFYTYAIGIILLIVVSLAVPGRSKYWDLGKTVRELNRGAEDKPTPPRVAPGVAAAEEAAP